MFIYNPIPIHTPILMTIPAAIAIAIANFNRSSMCISIAVPIHILNILAFFVVFHALIANPIRILD